MKNKTEYELHLGDLVSIKKSWVGKKLELCYAGKLNDDCYSLAIIITNGYNSYAYNLYISKKQGEIMLPTGRLSIIDLDETKIRCVFKSQ